MNSVKVIEYYLSFSRIIVYSYTWFLSYFQWFSCIAVRDYFATFAKPRAYGYVGWAGLAWVGMGWRGLAWIGAGDVGWRELSRAGVSWRGLAGAGHGWRARAGEC